MRPAVLLPCVLLAGCATYQPLALPTDAALIHDANRLSIAAARMPDAELAAHRFDASDGLDITEVAMLAVANNPDLQLLRADAGVTRAQAFAAGLLPDPQLALTRETVLGSPAGAAVALTAGLTLDIAALLARSSTHAAADAESRKIDLDLLWLEWQTVAKARLLFVKLDALARSLQVLQAQHDTLASRVADAQAAVDHGLISSDAAAPQLIALQDASKQIGDLQRQRNQARHDLDTLLGVAPETPLTLVGPADIATLDAGGVRDALAQAPRRRPDLLALQAGFEAQDDRYRGALRAQFPAITFGPTRGRDTSNVNTAGLSLGLTLPLFNRNRGNIAIESATRDKLRTDYQQRLDATAIESHRLLDEQALLTRQLAEIDASLPALTQAADRAAKALQASNIDALAASAVESALLARRLERIATQQALQEQAIALQALLGTPSNARASSRASTPEKSS
ncbi:MAG: TolC family protein [Burkholderiaceae bacterium]